MVHPLVWLGVTLVASALGAAPQVSAPTAIVVGTVVDAVSGRPVPSARVRLTPTDRQALPAVLTGPDGRFAFLRLAPGSYALSATRPGFLEGRFGRSRPEGSSVPLELDQDDRAGEIELRVWPAASISGTVFDEQARPLPGVGVFARRLLPGGADDPADRLGRGAITDRGGRYRVDGLTPGDYLVGVYRGVTTAPVPADADPVAPGTVAWPSEPGGPAIAVAADGARFTTAYGPATGAITGQVRATYATTYFGQAGTASGASPVTVEAGADRSGIDLTMRLRAAVSVSGAVTGLDAGEQGVVRLLAPDQQLDAFSRETLPVATAVTDPDGRFVMTGVPAGDYLLAGFARRAHSTIVVSQTGVPRIDPTIGPTSGSGRWSLMPISVGDQDASGVTVRLREGVRVRGRLQLASGVAEEPAPAGASIAIGDQSDRLTAFQTRTFEIAGIYPGLQPLSLRRGPADLDLVSVLVAGRQYAGLPLEIGDEDLVDVVITLGHHASVSGIVSESSSPEADATVVLFPTDSGRWRITRAGNRRMRTLRAGNGRFEISGIPPGEYFIAAVEDEALALWPAPAFLRRVAAGTTRLRVTLEAGAGAQVALTLDRSVR